VRGDASYFGVDLTVYSGIIRGYAFLDQSEYDKAIKVSSNEYAFLNRSNGLYCSQFIEIIGILSVSHSYLNYYAK